MPDAVRIEETEIETILRSLLSSKYADEKAWVVYDLERLNARLAEATEHFPSSAIHAVAVKANPLVEVLRELVRLGAGLECASIEEVHVALAAGAAGAHILFDSPAKTDDEIAFALERDMTLNLDNFDEVERVARILEQVHSQSRIGLRVNPNVGEGAIAATSVGGVRSRFGEVLDEKTSAKILACFQKYTWLNGVHVHVGSQGCSVEQLCMGAKKAVEFVQLLEKDRDRKLAFVDIGGGLPVDYGFQHNHCSLASYGNELKSVVPELFAGKWTVYTEFGRAIHANTAVAISRVEYAKTVDQDKVAVIHLGADMFMRPVYAAKDWKHQFSVFDRKGRFKQEDVQTVSIVGPLCFGGDVLVEGVDLPTIEVGDFVAIRDAGAYTLSMWSRHCSRGMPVVLGYEPAKNLQLLRRRETPEDIAQFWSL